jgi:hypothetical protein
MSKNSGIGEIAARCGLVAAEGEQDESSLWFRGSLASCKRAAIVLGLDVERISPTMFRLTWSADGSENAGDIFHAEERGFWLLRVAC